MQSALEYVEKRIEVLDLLVHIVDDVLLLRICEHLELIVAGTPEFLEEIFDLGLETKFVDLALGRDYHCKEHS